MLYILLAIFIIVAIIILVAVVRHLRKKRSTLIRTSVRPPELLGVRSGHPAKSVALRLESALDPDFVARVKYRVMKEYPKMKEQEWEWSLFHLKRFLLMSAVMRQVSMFSERVDAIWHEMLMFTREYQLFCERFCGGMIHHAPHSGGKSQSPGDRAWFDWVYGELFEPTPTCGRIWGAFYRHPLQRNQLGMLEGLPADQLRGELFHASAAAKFPDVAEVIDELISRAKAQISGARTHHLQGSRRSFRDASWDTAGYGLMGGALIFASMSDPGDFDRYMGEMDNEKQKQTSSSSCGSAYCTGDSGGSNDGNGGSNCSGGSSCSSGSSCGGGCSS